VFGWIVPPLSSPRSWSSRSSMRPMCFSKARCCARLVVVVQELERDERLRAGEHRLLMQPERVSAGLATASSSRSGHFAWKMSSNFVPRRHDAVEERDAVAERVIGRIALRAAEHLAQLRSGTSSSGSAHGFDPDEDRERLNRAAACRERMAAASASSVMVAR
jgi:hypothetical protein